MNFHLNTYNYIDPMARAYSLNSIEKANFKTLPFEGKFLKLIGKPELRGVWTIQGKSGHGKTTFTLSLCKYLTNFGRVAYNSLEQGFSRSMQIAIRKANMMSECGGKFLLLDKEPKDELIERLDKHKSPDVVVIDTWQYSMLSFKELYDLEKKYPKKLFIVITHEEGKDPEGRSAKKVKYHADCKFRVIGYVAFCISRYHEDKIGEPFIIWPEEAVKYHPFLDQTKTLEIL